MNHRSFLILLLCLLMLPGCSNGAEPKVSPGETMTTKVTEAPKPEESLSTEMSGTASRGLKQQTDETSKPVRTEILVVYFSRTGEQYNVGVIYEGNTAIVAKIIAAETGADMYEILPLEDYYPYTYRELTDVAKKEQKENTRPAIGTAVPDLSGYQTIFIGAPVWWGDWPMILYTFFEENAESLKGKTLIPFCTHEGSGLSGFDKQLAKACPDSTIGEGFAITGRDAQNDRDRVRQKVQAWLKELG